MQFVTVNKISPKWHTLNIENCIRHRRMPDCLHYQKQAWQAVHLGEYKIHPHKIISEVSYKLVTIKLAETQEQPKTTDVFIIL